MSELSQALHAVWPDKFPGQSEKEPLRSKYERSILSRHAGLCGCGKCVRGRDEMRVGMIRCPSCGNKRCPHASDHDLACTNSNEAGQPGSVYT